jgi:hypothetical protein
MLGGECLNKSKRNTDPASKWYITPEEYPSDYYPGHCSGYGYVTSMSVAKKIVRVSNNVPFFHLEDVYSYHIFSIYTRCSPNPGHGMNIYMIRYHKTWMMKIARCVT